MREIDPPDDALLAVLSRWMPMQRWYPLKGVRVAVSPGRSFALAEDVAIHLVHLDHPAGTVVAQVPLVLGGIGPAGTDPIGTCDGVAVWDGAGDPRYWQVLLRAAHWDGPRPHVWDLTGGRLVTGEQSNSSVLLPHAAGGVIAKVLRTVGDGPNPDLTVPLALTRAGWHGVPTPRAWLALDGTDSESTLLAVICDLVTAADDGFELACAMAGRGESFDDLAADLGATVAEMHSALARALPDGGRLNVEWFMTDLRSRAVEAGARADAVASRAGRIGEFHDALAATLAEADPVTLPRLQAVHGDLHLGQVIHAREGWRVLDFEGEPMRTAADRARPDLALRDVAGLLRSLDYAAAVGGTCVPEWADRARRSFLTDYWDRAGRTLAADALLDALLLDRALYEVVYESRNRPAWQPIPLAAVDRLLEGRRTPSDRPVASLQSG